MFNPLSPIPDQVLLHRMASRDATALIELQRRHSTSIYALVYGIMMDADLANRVVTEVFEQVWQAAALLSQQRRGASTWLRQLATERARAHRAAESR
ncbi:MAG TPA: hypothetical protein VGQ06_01310 [Gemmatimonadales bacterium]|jgi:DNA-directed RNA polymerase specialized sigma24 family protein|nr:hypothetical protein [Gemmatimonadales bacterium]